jgi:hypothetical protein
MERDGLFIDDLSETLSHVRAAPATESPDITTQALGEETSPTTAWRRQTPSAKKATRSTTSL